MQRIVEVQWQLKQVRVPARVQRDSVGARATRRHGGEMGNACTTYLIGTNV